MRQAIQTKYLGPTDFKGARIKAFARAQQRTKPRAGRFGWTGEWIGGGLPDSGYAFVQVEDNERAFTLRTQAA